MLHSEIYIEIWNVHIIAFCFYSQFVQCPNFFGIGFVSKYYNFPIFSKIFNWQKNYYLYKI